MDRKARGGLHQRRSRIVRRSASTDVVEFFNVLTSQELLQTTEALLPEHRERLYPPTVTLSMFMHQTLESDGSCQKAVPRTDGWRTHNAPRHETADLHLRFIRAKADVARDTIQRRDFIGDHL